MITTAREQNPETNIDVLVVEHEAVPAGALHVVDEAAPRVAMQRVRPVRSAVFATIRQIVGIDQRPLPAHSNTLSA